MTNGELPFPNRYEISFQKRNSPTSSWRREPKDHWFCILRPVSTNLRRKSLRDHQDNKKSVTTYVCFTHKQRESIWMAKDASEFPTVWPISRDYNEKSRYWVSTTTLKSGIANCGNSLWTAILPSSTTSPPRLGNSKPPAHIIAAISNQAIRIFGALLRQLENNTPTARFDTAEGNFRHRSPFAFKLCQRKRFRMDG